MQRFYKLKSHKNVFRKVSKDATNAHFGKNLDFLTISAFYKIVMMVNLIKKNEKCPYVSIL